MHELTQSADLFLAVQLVDHCTQGDLAAGLVAAGCGGWAMQQGSCSCCLGLLRKLGSGLAALLHNASDPVKKFSQAADATYWRHDSHRGFASETNFLLNFNSVSSRLRRA